VKCLAPLAVLAVFAPACAHVPLEPEADRAAKEFAPVPGKTALYVFRDQVQGADLGRMSVWLDGALLGETTARTFLYATLESGRHTLESRSVNGDLLALDALPGQILYVRQEVQVSFFWTALGVPNAVVKLRLVDPRRAEARVRSCQLAASRKVPFVGEPRDPPEPGASADR
jgi:hypothetical protein